jgi:hypothetical protein
MVQQHFRLLLLLLEHYLRKTTLCDPFIIQQVFIMMQERPICPHQAIKPKSKLVPVARQQLRPSL